MSRLGKVRLVTLVALLIVTTAFAGTKTANIAVTANIQPSCAIVGHPLAFGTYDPLGVNATAPLYQATTINVTCVAEIAATVSLNQGLYPKAGSTSVIPTRQMQCLSRDGEFLRYFLQQDSAHTKIFAAGANALTITGDGTMRTYNLYGSIPAGQTSEGDGFADKVVATVTY